MTLSQEYKRAFGQGLRRCNYGPKGGGKVCHNLLNDGKKRSILA